MDIILNNLPLVGTVLAMVAGVILYGRGRLFFEWVNETLFMAFDSAEKKGLLEGISGADKLRYYLEIWREAYSDRFGKEVPQPLINYAVSRAGELAEKEKDIKKIVESMASPK